MIKEIFHDILSSDHPIRQIIIDAFDGISFIWNYKIFTTSDKQVIAISNLVIGFILFIIGIRIVKRISAYLRGKIIKVVKEEAIANSVERFVHYAILIFMIIIVLDVANVPLTIFNVIGTTLALGLGLGSQNIVNNFISGIIIMIERPIKVGDVIEAKNFVGKVTNIGARCTSVMTNNNINILIPNSSILQDNIINWTLEDTLLRMNYNISLSNNVSIEIIEKLFRDTLDSHPNILKNPFPQILVKELLAEGYTFEIDFWIDLKLNISGSRIINDINRLLDPKLKELSISVVTKKE